MTTGSVPENLKVRSVADKSKGKFRQAFEDKFGKHSAAGMMAHKPKEGSAAEEKGESKKEAASEGDAPKFGSKHKGKK